MKLQSAVCVDQSSTSNALERSVFALVVRLLMAGRSQHLSKLCMMARACHQRSLFILHLSLHLLDFSLIFSPKQGRTSFGGRGIAVLWSSWVLCQICLYELSCTFCAPLIVILPQTRPYCTAERRFLVILNECNKMQCNPAVLLLAVSHILIQKRLQTNKNYMRCACRFTLSWRMKELFILLKS